MAGSAGLPKSPPELEVPLVVLQKERVLTCSTAAVQAGIEAGMRAGSVRVLAPQARVHVRDSAREQEALQHAAFALLQFTPQVAMTGSASLVLDIGASLRLFGGVLALCRRVRACLRSLGYVAVLSCAPNPWAAEMLARAAGLGRARRYLKLARLHAALDHLPCALLEQSRDMLDWLEGIACYRLGQLRRLPRPGLQRRCGRELLPALDALYKKPDPGLSQAWSWVQTPQEFTAKRELFARIEESAHLLPHLQAMLQEMCGWLQSRHLALQGMALIFTHERGRLAREPTRLDIFLAEPNWQQTHLLHLLREHVGRLQLDAAVIFVQMQALRLQSRQNRSEDLFACSGLHGAPSGGQEAAARLSEAGLLELLSARLGAENVLQAIPRADFRPELANQWQPATYALAGAVRAGAVLSAFAQNFPRPLCLLPQAQALQVRAERPLYGGPLLLVSAAERIEAGWYGGPFVCRDYFVAQSMQGQYYWLYRQRPANRQGDADVQWFVQGLFA